jgi:NADPH2:quinone reductase
MRAATIRDGRVFVAEHPDPEPGAGQVLVRVHAAGINGADIHQRGGHYPAPPGSPPDIPGLELAGEVAARGPGAERFAEGDRVMGIVGGGGQAELCVVHERQLMPVPELLSWAEAGGVPEVFTTAHVAATVRNADLREDVAALGAEAVLDPADFGDYGPYDVVLELVGAPNFERDIATLATGGRIVVIGIGAGAKASVNFGAMMAKRATVRASALRPRPLEEKAATARAMERHVLPLLGRGAMRVPVAATYPLDAVDEAYERFTAGGKFGKIVLELQ